MPGCALVLMAAGLIGCSPVRPHTGSPPQSHAIPPGIDGLLDVALLPHLTRHGGRTGVRLVSDGLDAFALRALSASLASRSLDLQYYIWQDDLTGRYLARELLQAADRGVRVRLLLDDMDARKKDIALEALDQHPAIEVRIFNPFATRSGTLRTMFELLGRGSRLTHRMHNKAWIVDGRLALIGGRNIGDEYFTASEQMNFLDLDVALVGPAVEQASASFDRYWNSTSAVPVNRLRRVETREDSLDALRSALERAADAARDSDYARRLEDSQRLAAMLQGESIVTWTEDVDVVTDDPRKAETSPSIDPGVLESLTAEFRAARSELLILSPYFVPAEGGTTALIALREQGIDIGVLTNSLAATDVAAVHSGYAPHRKPLLAGGVSLFELKPLPERLDHPPFGVGSSQASLHTKAMLVDQTRLFVGSFNLDPRSAHLNCEMGVWLTSPELATELRSIYRRATAPTESFELSLDESGRIVWTEIRDGEVLHHDQDPYASWGRRALVRFLRLLPVESQL